MLFMGADAFHTAHSVPLIHSTLTTTHDICVTSSHSIFLFGYGCRSLSIFLHLHFPSLLLLLLLPLPLPLLPPTTFSYAAPSRKHILVFIGGICCIIQTPKNHLDELHILRKKIFSIIHILLRVLTLLMSNSDIHVQSSHPSIAN